MRKGFQKSLIVNPLNKEAASELRLAKENLKQTKTEPQSISKKDHLASDLYNIKEFMRLLILIIVNLLTLFKGIILTHFDLRFTSLFSV